MTDIKRSCFVIMPISDFPPYPEGHFKRVYEYLIKPACEKAGFVPIRADDILNTNFIALDIIKNITSADMAICDLSGRNPNVLYELGIRQAFNLPITLIKDNKTNRIFDIQGFRDIEYDELLRIDNVESSIDTIASTLLNTYESKGNEINSLISLLSIEPARLENKTISADTEIILNYLQDINKRINDLEDKSRKVPEYIDHYISSPFTMRLSIIAKKIGIGTSTIVNVLAVHGINVVNNPNTRLSIEEIKIIEEHFMIDILENKQI